MNDKYTTLLSGVVGSTAYGLATDDSDIDMLGVFAVDTEDLFTLNGSGLLTKTKVTTDPDVTMHEVAKFCNLAAACNPTVSELLWLGGYVEMNNLGALLLEIRKSFLSNRVKNTYGGYATQQMKRLEGRGDGSFKSKLRKRKEKHGRHLVRLLIQGSMLLSTGELRVRLTDDEAALCREISVLDDVSMRKWFDEAIASMDAIDSCLPEAPDYDTINDVLRTVRLSMMGIEQAGALRGWALK